MPPRKPEPVVSPGHIRCTRTNVTTNWRCCNVFVPEEGAKGTRCQKCRGNNSQYKKSDKGRAAQRKHDAKPSETLRKSIFKKTEAGKASEKKYKRSDVGKKTNKKYATSEKGRAVFSRASEKWKNSEHGKRKRKEYKASDVGKKNNKKYKESNKGRASQKKYKSKLGTRIADKIGKQIRGVRPDFSGTLLSYTDFTTEEDIRKHFRLSMDHSWMTFENRAAYVSGMPYKTVWHIGHRIPRSAYGENEDDIRKCWQKANLFAQDGRENVELNDKLPARDVLMALRHIWPSSWHNQLPLSCLVPQ